METHNTSIEDVLPHDCIALIFKFLTIPERWIAAQVCHRWNEIDEYSTSSVKTFDDSDPSWAHIFDPENELIQRQEIMEDIMVKYGKHIRHLKYHGLQANQFIPFVNFSSTIPDISERLQTFNVFGGSYRYMLDALALKCTRLVDFRYVHEVIHPFNKIGNIFQNNPHLKNVGIGISKRGGKCLYNLMDRSLKELVIISAPEQIIADLVKVLENLRDLKILRLHLDSNVTDVSNFANAFAKFKCLQKLTIKGTVRVNSLFPLLKYWDHLLELKLPNNIEINKKFLSRVSLTCRNLISLDISGCEKVTDRDLKILSKLRSIEKLNIDYLRIGGTGLNKFKKLKYLSCKRSHVFDQALRCVLHSCDDLNFLDITDCVNISLTTIDTAMKIVNLRRNNKLRILLDFQLAFNKKLKVPPLLELNCKISCLSDREAIDYTLSGKNVGQSSYVINENVEIMDMINSQIINFVPRLVDHYLLNILRFLSIPKQIKLIRVSKEWERLINQSLRSITKIDLSIHEWKYLFFNKSVAQMKSIINQVLMKCGKNVKDLVLEHTHVIDYIMKNCPLLETITNRGSTARIFDPSHLAVHQTNLTVLSLFNGNFGDSALSRVFESNRNLKSITLFNLFVLQYTCFFNLNPDNIEILHLHQMDLAPNRQKTRNFCKALSRFVNLRDIKVIPGYVQDEIVIGSIRSCTRLKSLTIEHYANQTSLTNLNSIFELKDLERLSVRNFLQLQDIAFEEMATHLEFISHIDITDCKNVTDVGLQMITTLPNLEELIMRGLPNVKGTGLSLLSGPTFQRLECQLCYCLQSDSLCEVLQNCPNLMVLNVAKCSRLNEKIIDTAIEVTNSRTNGIMLKLIADSRLTRVKRAITPPLLEVLIYEKPEENVLI